jgi:hypothetical protein
MKHIYRIFFLAILFCTFAKSGAAIGHTVSINSYDVLCFGTCTGSATATVTGGVGPFTYAWSPSGGTSANATGLCAGSYTATVTDQSDMSTATATVMITQPTAVSAWITSTVNPTCNMCNGSITANVGGGVAPYTFLWWPGNITSATFTNACAGTYTLSVTDANGCTATTTASLWGAAPPNSVSVTATPTVVCVGQTTQLNASFTGGTPPFNFNWTGGPVNFPASPTPIATPTVTTTYSITITDGLGCTAMGTVLVVVNPAVSANISSTDPTCNQSNGSLTVNVTQAAAPYSILWSNLATTPTISNIGAGAYNVTVTDANSCTLNLPASLNNIGGPTVTTSVVDAGCTNSLNGNATANASGLSPFTYLWSSAPAQTTMTANNLGVGNYQVTVTDNIGCVTVANAQVNAMSGNLYLYACASSAANCMLPNGSAFAYVQGGAMPYSYLWSNSSTTSTISSVSGGQYIITVTDANGCTQTGSATIPTACNNFVMGQVFYDMNNDGVFNSGDSPYSGLIVGDQTFNYYSSSANSGYYTVSVPYNGTFDFELPNAPPYYTYNAPSGGHQIVTFAGLGDTSFVDFALTCPLNVQDLYLNLASGIARPGFQQAYSVFCQNRGATTVSDTIWFRHDSILSLVSANPPFDGYTYPDGYWLFSNFAPGNTITKNILMQVPTIPNGGYVGRQLIANARIEPMSSDTTSPDNGDDEMDIIIASSDPNLKESWSPTMNAAGEIGLNDLELDYTIHFQNCGNDTAFFIIVVDTLPAELDITTFEPGAASHSYTWTIDGHNDTNIVTFTFLNILLPDSGVNEIGSHGYVQFTIERFPNLPIGTTIVNNGDNYFDFNLPVPTNYDVVTITDPLNVEALTEGTILVYPNPAHSNVNILLSNEFSGSNSTVTLRDISGRTISTMQSNGSTQLVLNTENCSAGMYFITVESASEETITREIIILKK